MTSPSLRSDGKLRDFDWQHFNKMVEEAERRRAAGQVGVPRLPVRGPTRGSETGRGADIRARFGEVVPDPRCRDTDAGDLTAVLAGF